MVDLFGHFGSIGVGIGEKVGEEVDFVFVLIFEGFEVGTKPVCGIINFGNGDVERLNVYFGDFGSVDVVVWEKRSVGMTRNPAFLGGGFDVGKKPIGGIDVGELRFFRFEHWRVGCQYKEFC